MTCVQKIALTKDEVLNAAKGMAFHPALRICACNKMEIFRLFKMWAIPILHVLIFEVKKFGNRSHQSRVFK
jgi:hypothetical protein